MSSDRQIDIILSIFDNIDQSLTLDHIIEQLSTNYKYPEKVVKEAIDEGLLYIDEITDIRTNNQVFLALTEWGEELWDDLYE